MKRERAEPSPSSVPSEFPVFHRDPKEGADDDDDDGGTVLFLFFFRGWLGPFLNFQPRVRRTSSSTSHRFTIGGIANVPGVFLAS